MEAILCEDLNLKEDQARLLRCKDYFRQPASELTTENILLFLFDKWSAIRQECGKQMASVPSLVCDEVSASLLSTCKNTSHWQEVHGSILGLSALIGNADTITDSDLFGAVSNICLEFIGHVSIPVKEAVRQCLITVQKRRANKYELVNQLVKLINDAVRAPNHDSEAVSLTLDGLLGCLVDNYNLFPQLMAPESGPGGAENTSIDVVATIRLCALHSASTVRQKAGQILTVFVLSCLDHPDNADADGAVQVSASAGVVGVITDMLMQALRSTESAHWRLQEISLMVAEEVVCAVISAQLEKLETLASQGNSSSANICQPPDAGSSLLQQACAFLDFLKNHLQVLLGHAQFEVRRMAIQLAPQLARAFVLMNAPLSALDQDTALIPISFALDCSLNDPPPPANQENLHNPSYASAESGDQIENRISLGSRSDGSLEGDTNEEDCGALHVQLNSSFRSHAETEGAGPGLDLELVSRTVWLNELIKENQHLFEAYSLSESWACNSVTKDLQLRSYSIKDESHRYWADSASRYHHIHGVPVQPNRTVAAITAATTAVQGSQAAGGNGLARGVVDHWSLDVRGRLQEIEERTQFHRTVKAIVSTEVTAEACTVIVLLMRNCRSLLCLVDDMLQAWETVFTHKGSWTAMTDFAASLNSLRSANTSAAALTVDFVENLALMESFLLSVQYRFSQCPDIQAALSVASADAAGMIVSAGTLRQRLGALRGEWITHVARIQCVSRCSTHVSTRSGVTGQAHQRPSATMMLLTILRQRQDCMAARSDLFASVDHEEWENSGIEQPRVDAEETAEKSVVSFLTKLVQAQMHVAESKEGGHPRGSAQAIEEVFCEMFSDRVILIPSITNASLSVGTGASSSFHSHANAPTSTGGDAAHVLSPSHGVHHSAGSVASTPQSSTAAHPKSAFSAGFSMHSPGSHLGAPHAYTGALGGSHGRYQAMDQWNCEAVSPVLTCLANAAGDATEALQLSAVVVEWVAACVINPLWLDCRHNARKNLFEALVLLLSTAEKSAASEVQPTDSVYCLLALKITRAVAEVLALRGSKPLLEQKVLICLVKAAGSAIRVCQRLETALRSVFVNSPGTAVAWSDVRNVQFRTTVEECCIRISQSLQYYREVFPQPSPHSHAELVQQQESTKPVSSAPAACDQAEVSEDASEEIEASSSSDEFSDWDEESEEDEDAVATTGLSATGDLALSLGNILWEEMTSLQDQVDQWQLSSAF